MSRLLEIRVTLELLYALNKHQGADLSTDKLDEQQEGDPSLRVPTFYVGTMFTVRPQPKSL